MSEVTINSLNPVLLLLFPPVVADELTIAGVEVTVAFNMHRIASRSGIRREVGVQLRRSIDMLLGIADNTLPLTGMGSA